MKYAATTLKVDQAAIDWFVKVFTVGGTLALSGGDFPLHSPHS